MNSLSPEILLVVIGILFVFLMIAVLKMKEATRVQKILEQNLVLTQSRHKELLNEEKKLLKTVCHDLANPIMIIGSYLSMIKSGRISKDNLDEIINKIQSNTDSALSIITRIKESSLQKKDQ